MQSKLLKEKIDVVFLGFLFATMLMPIYMDVNGSGVSINYNYVLFAIYLFLNQKEILIPEKNILIVIIYYIFIYFFLLYQYENDYYLIVRQLFSFCIFMTMFAFIFCKFSNKIMPSLKIGILIASLSMAVPMLVGSIMDLDRQFSLKSLWGTQRTGFMYVFSFWIVYYAGINRVLKLTGLSIFLLAILFTFSRTAVLSFFFSIGIFFLIEVYKIKEWRKKFTFIFWVLFACFVSLIIIYYSGGESNINFYLERLLFLKTSNTIIEFNNPNSSEGYRIHLWNKILQFNMINFFGSGYLGTWMLGKGDEYGSAHSQYFDVFFRTGWLGLIFFIYLYFRILKYLYAKHTGLFVGFCGFVIFGLFHESTKLSHGGLITSVLLSAAINKVKFNKKNYFFFNFKKK